MNFQSVNEIIKHYTKEDKLMQSDRFSDEMDEARMEKWEAASRRELSNRIIREQLDPSFRVTPDDVEAEQEEME